MSSNPKAAAMPLSPAEVAQIAEAYRQAEARTVAHLRAVLEDQRVARPDVVVPAEVAFS